MVDSCQEHRHKWAFKQAFKIVPNKAKDLRNIDLGASLEFPHRCSLDPDLLPPQAKLREYKVSVQANS